MIEDSMIVRYRLTPGERARLEKAVAGACSRRSWVRVAYLYGSVARGEQPARDVDIGVVAARPPEWTRSLAELQHDITTESELPCEIDVRVLNGASPVFLNRVLSDGHRLYEADLASRVRFEAYAMARWLDFRPAWDRVRTVVLKRWSDG